MEISEIRKQIDEIDESITDLFAKRMTLSAQIADYKKENNLPIFVPEREREILRTVAQQAGAEFSDYTRVLYNTIFDLSRSYQGKRNTKESTLYKRIADSIETTPRLFPQSPMVACQGVEGSYAQIACERVFKSPMIMYFKNFDGVFSAIEQGLCQYGILPIENSAAGSVKKVYDLMIHRNFSIVRSCRLKIDHNLLAKAGTKPEDIKEIYSHEQAINQCTEYLKRFPGAKIIPVENTAVAASMVSRSECNDTAAIAGKACCDLYGLECLDKGIQDEGNNHTRFICISRNTEIYPGADKTTIMMILSHKPGALYKVMARMYILGINVIKLESRPIPDRDFEFMFYFDLETSVYSEEFIQLMCELDDLCEEFKYLGSYTEVV